MRPIDRVHWGALVVGAVLSASAADARAQGSEKEFERTPARCVSISAINKTHAIDDRTILFFMRGNRIYRNYLPSTCRDLARHDRIAYGTSGGSALAQICSNNAILVLDRDLRTNGAPCPLGPFYPITKDEAELLTRKSGDRRDAVKVETVELPPAGDATDAKGSAPEPGKDESPKATDRP